MRLTGRPGRITLQMVRGIYRSARQQREVLWDELADTEYIPVCCTHLGLPSDERINQITAMLEWLP